ncbi:heme-degrading domain-containing protein [Tengunoibacter tsumagoiensis]|uniref:UPF0303 protein KTT_59710 n=1 Tax=Tengunoibacter tsumagoiensis TaxID=2014871 RepID=A0A402AAA8_9CHLR|nr:heme-degrading domain-containing protein [Tengunoibacter tsumagoiensis]GCE16112.1 UPF0303 protein [Tengunoibacter tsumagoiensis]
MSDEKNLLESLLQQEDELQFSSFSHETAWQLGVALVEAAKQKKKGVTVDITRSGQQLFHYALPGTAPDNDEWIKRKNNIVNRFGHSSWYIGQSLKQAGKTLEEKYLISTEHFAPHGGAFPLIIKQVGVIGTITVSGLPQQEDHELVTSTIRTFLKRQP